MSNNKELLEPIAIVGVGGIFPGSADIPAFWDNILKKIDSIVEVPADRWDWRLYYDPNPSAVDKTYSKIGGFVRNFQFDPLKLRIPPPVAQQMDSVQKMAVAATAEALRDSGYDKKPYNTERTAVILGNSMGGPKKEATDLRVYAPFYQKQLAASPAFTKLPTSTREAILAEMAKGAQCELSTITEDTMPGELSNVIAGRVANVFNFNGANFTVDAACASSLAALDQAIKTLRFHEFDMVVCGGVDQMMSPPSYVKFCKIGALSPDGSRPFDAAANGFVMGEGAGVCILKRLSDALRDGDKVYALIRAIGSSSDGRGKGITAPNPKGQKLAVERAFAQLDYAPGDVGLLEAHGTSTKVGDVVEVNVATEIFKPHHAKGAVGLGSVKSQIGHLKAAAGVASLIKTALAIKHKTLPPSINFKTPNPGIEWNDSPFFVITEPREWESPNKPRRANVSSFGFGGTNFHVALEEATPETTARWEKAAAAARQRYSNDAGPGDGGRGPENVPSSQVSHSSVSSSTLNLAPTLAGEVFLIHGAAPDAVFDRIKALKSKLQGSVIGGQGSENQSSPLTPHPSSLTSLAYEINSHKRDGEYRLCFAAESSEKLREKIEFILRMENPSIWEKAPPLFRAKGIYAGHRKKPGKIGFLFPGQGSQYVDMIKDLHAKYAVVARTFAEADDILKDLIGAKLTDILFTKGGDTPKHIATMEERIKQTEVTQPAVLTADIAILRLLETYGVRPDVVCGHSLGEYGALVAAGVLSFKDALLAVSARGKEMAGVRVKDSGKMASVAASIEKIEPALKKIGGYVVAANKNCPIQTVIAGETGAVEAAVKEFNALGIQAQEIRVSHAFHSKIVEPAQKPYRRFLERIALKAPQIPILSNVTAAYYPSDIPGIRDLMVSQIASPVEFIRQTERMYQDGVRLFVEVGPKRVLTAFVTSTLEGRKDAAALSSNHPKRGGILEFNDLLARLDAESVELKLDDKDPTRATAVYTSAFAAWINSPESSARIAPPSPVKSGAITRFPSPLRGEGQGEGDYTTPTPHLHLAHYNAPSAAREVVHLSARHPLPQGERDINEKWGFYTGPVVVSGVAAGTPGAWDRVFREDNIDQILRGQNLIGRLADDDLDRQIDKNIVRLIKSATGDHRLERIQNAAEVVHLAAAAGEFDLAKEFGFKESIANAMDISSRLAVAAGILALKDAGIPLVPTYKQTTTGSNLHTGWALPEPLRSETGVIFATSFPSIDSMASEVSRYLADKFRRKPLRELASLLESLITHLKNPEDRAAVEHWYASNFRSYMERYGKEGPYEFSREFLLRVMPLGHSQLMQWIGATGPGSQISAACASTTQAVAMAEDWIRLGRAKRAIVIAGDDVTSPALREWIVTGFLTAGAATTTGVVSEAALPFDKRRHGMILGMGAAGLVIEQGARVEERGMRPLTEILATQYENSSYHATRLHVEHVSGVMERLLVKAEKRWGLDRRRIASKTLFMSHETYTPARGGSASAEVEALKRAFGSDAGRVIVANTKGFHGHSMGASIEEPVSIRALITGQVPPIANYKEPDPDLAGITLSRGGEYDLEYVLRLGAGFGSQIAMTLMHRTLKKGENRIFDPACRQNWLKLVSGLQNPELEVIHNTLRVRAKGVPTRTPSTPAPAAPERTPKTPVSGGQGRQNVAPAQAGVQHTRESLFLDSRLRGNDESTSLRSEAPAKVPDVRFKETYNEEQVRNNVVKLVSEKTGYPAEMLELDLDLEADLGIDTVKQAELIGIIREQYSIPRRENLTLKDYPTLRHVIRFVLESQGSGESTTTVSTASEVSAPESNQEQVFPTSPIISSPLKNSLDVARDEIKADRTHAETLTEEAVRETVVKLVSEKTGYPAEMLELDLDLEADLGIDTVKQAEMFGILRENYGIPRREGIALKDYPTLRHLIRFILEATVSSPRVGEEQGEGKVSYSHPHPNPLPSRERESATSFRRWVLQAYERPLPSAKRTLDKKRPVLILSGDAASAAPFEKILKGAGLPCAVVAVSNWKNQDAAGKTLREALKKEKAQGILCLTGLALKDFKPSSADLFERQYAQTARALFFAAKTLAEDLAIRGSWVFALTRIDGAHGANSSQALFHPLAGAITGLAKALRKEFTGLRVGALDFETNASAKEIAEIVFEEISSEDSQTEIGYRSGKRQAIRLTPQELTGAGGQRPGDKLSLTPESIVLITGGGQGLGAECAKAIAQKYRSKLAIVGRTPLDSKAKSWAALSAEGLKALKQELWRKMKSDKSRKATPVMLEREFSKITKAVGLQRNLETMRSAGSEVTYIAADLADGPSTQKAFKNLPKPLKTPDLILHAAGLEESKRLIDKTPESFDEIFRAKACGALHLLNEIDSKAGQAWAFFSSVVGRFGNMAQVDYAAASDFLAKLSTLLRRQGKNAVAVDLTAIADIGMATRGSTEQFLKSQGVDFMPPAKAVEMILKEALNGAAEPEVLLAGSLGRLDQDGQMQRPDSLPPLRGKAGMGGNDEPRRQTIPPPSSSPTRGEEIQKRASAEKTLIDRVLHQEIGREIVTEKAFSLESDPWLADHSILGTPYVAGVMGLELFAETIQNASGKIPNGFSNVRFSLPIKLLRNKPVTVRTLGRKNPADANAWDLRIESDFFTPQGIKLGGPRVHFTAKFLHTAPHLDPCLPAGRLSPQKEGAEKKMIISPETIYSAYFHGPSFQVLRGIISLSEREILAQTCEPSKPLWPDAPRNLIFHPMLLEAAFQACGYRDLHFAKKMTLPDSIGQVHVFGTSVEKPKSPLYVHAIFKGTDKEGKSLYDAQVFDSDHRVWAALKDYRMVPI